MSTYTVHSACMSMYSSVFMNIHLLSIIFNSALNGGIEREGSLLVTPLSPPNTSSLHSNTVVSRHSPNTMKWYFNKDRLSRGN